MNLPEFKIGNRSVGLRFEPLVIAEIGINHAGSLDVAIAMADAAISAGVEVVKHQTHIPEDEMSIEARYVKPGNSVKSIWEVISSCALSEQDEFKLMQHVTSKNCMFISTPFSRMALERLIRFDIPAFKIGSGECNNYPLIKLIARQKKPVILSTGMNSVETISPSVEIFRKMNVPFALLHTTNLYPTPNELLRLGALNDLRDNFPDAVLGLSDHSTSNSACIGAVALGASILERHFTDSKDRQGPDIVCSMDGTELKQLIKASKEVYLARGGNKLPAKEEAVTIAFAFASVVADKDLLPGDTLSPENIWVRRPSGGDFNASDYEALFGRKVKNSIQKNTQIKVQDLE